MRLVFRSRLQEERDYYKELAEIYNDRVKYWQEKCFEIADQFYKYVKETKGKK